MRFFEFLGTGTSQGVPIIGSQHPVCLSSDFKDKRLRSSLYINLEDVCLLIDCGPDFRQQMLRSNLSKVDAILLTHEHNDHVLGLDDVRPINFMMQKDMPIYGLERTLNEVTKRFPYAFSKNKYPGAPQFELFPVHEHDLFHCNSIPIQTLPIMHGSLPIIGYKIGDLCYITDASYLSEAVIRELFNVTHLVINSLRMEKEHPAHFILPQTLDIIQKIQPKNAYITHVSHLIGFHEEVQKTLPKNVYLAHDGMRIVM